MGKKVTAHSDRLWRENKERGTEKVQVQPHKDQKTQTELDYTLRCTFSSVRAGFERRSL